MIRLSYLSMELLDKVALLLTDKSRGEKRVLIKEVEG